MVIIIVDVMGIYIYFVSREFSLYLFIPLFQFVQQSVCIPFIRIQQLLQELAAFFLSGVFITFVNEL